MDEMKERVKRRSLFRRETLAAGRYVRFEESADERLVALSDNLGIEVAEAVRIAVDELFDRKPLQAILKMKTNKADSDQARPSPKAIAGALQKRSSEPKYISFDDLGVPA